MRASYGARRRAARAAVAGALAAAALLGACKLEMAGDAPLVAEQVPFAADSAALPEAAGPVLDGLARWLAERQDVARLRVDGYADPEERGGAGLALARADAVVQALVARGVARERLQPVGFTPREGVRGADARRVGFTVRAMRDPGEVPGLQLETE